MAGRRRGDPGSFTRASSVLVAAPKARGALVAGPKEPEISRFGLLRESKRGNSRGGGVLVAAEGL